MFTTVTFQFQQIRKQVKKNDEAVLINMTIAKHDFRDKFLRRLKLILRLGHSTSKKENAG
jgi:hypothetical protein